MDSSQATKRLPPDAYNIALICALEVEMSAVRYMLEEEHARLPSARGDPNHYILGQLSGHNVVIATLPAGYQGTVSAATVASHTARTFQSITLGLLIGIGGGVPIGDIRLGDVAVSIPTGTHSGVVAYDLGKQTTSGFARKGTLSPPPRKWLMALNSMQSDHRVRPNYIQAFITDMLRRFPTLDQWYRRPPEETDVLFQSDYVHVMHATSCRSCDQSKTVYRSRRSPQSSVHYGLIASGNRVIKDAIERDRISAELGGAICFEMEAADLMNDFGCIVIRGISDYADSHKNDMWRPYAAAAAAALAKEMLSYIQPGSDDPLRGSKKSVESSRIRYASSAYRGQEPVTSSSTTVPETAIDASFRYRSNRPNHFEDLRKVATPPRSSTNISSINSDPHYQPTTGYDPEHDHKSEPDIIAEDQGKEHGNLMTGYWYCCRCGGLNQSELARKRCPVCSHMRNFCCQSF